jgi:hypothetical protein
MTTSVTFDAAILLMIRAVHFKLRSCSQHVSRISCAMCGNFLRFHMESFRETSKLLKLCDILCNQNTDLPYRLDTKPMHRDPYLQNYMVHTLKSSSCKYKQIHTIVLSTNDAFHSSRTIVIMSWACNNSFHMSGFPTTCIYSLGERYMYLEVCDWHAWSRVMWAISINWCISSVNFSYFKLSLKKHERDWTQPWL